jgi:hypothetical protein
MASSDSLGLLMSHVARELHLRDINDTLALVGLCYTAKTLLKVTSVALSFAKTYLLSSLISNKSWLRSMGSWGIVTGCTTGIGLGFAQELAKRGLNLILIDKNQNLIDKVADDLGINFNFFFLAPLTL